MTEEPALLSLRHITQRYSHGAVIALDDVSVDVGTNEAVGVVGESGSGKSTLARIAVGLEDPAVGSVLWRGHQLQAGGRTLEERRQIQVIFQDPRSSLNPRMCIFDAVEDFAIIHHRGGKSDRRKQVVAALERVHLTEKVARRRPPELSGGQLQRACIARALVADPCLLVADEPTSALDVSIQGQVLNLLKELSESLAIILISHDISVIRFIVERVYVLYRGVVVEEGAKGQVLEKPNHQYTQRLVSAANSLTPDTLSYG